MLDTRTQIEGWEASTGPLHCGGVPTPTSNLDHLQQMRTK